MLNELLEEYKESNDKQSIIKEFTNMLWNSKYIFKKHKKYYKYKVKEESLKNRMDLVKLFEDHSVIEFTFCKSYYKKRLDYIDYIRVHVNNMYGLLVDKTVYLPKEYYQLLLTPKREYYKTVNMLENGENVYYEIVKNTIDIASIEAERIKNEALHKKIDVKWRDYKKLINTYIERIFNNYIPPYEYEKKHGWEMNVSVDGWSENNYIIKYFCKSLTGYMMNYIRDSQPKIIKLKQCVCCEKEFEYISSKKTYCDECKKKKQLEWQRNSMKKIRNK